VWETNQDGHELFPSRAGSAIDPGNLGALDADPCHQSLLAEYEGIGIILQ
jgi:hypothetical protein